MHGGNKNNKDQEIRTFCFVTLRIKIVKQARYAIFCVYGNTVNNQSQVNKSDVTTSQVTLGCR